MQFQTTTIHFDPDFTFEQDDFEPNSSPLLKNWPSFHITYADGRRLVFNLKEGVAYEQLEIGGPFYPLMVHQHEYRPAIIKSEDECCFEDKDGNLDFDPTLLVDWGQRGWLSFTRPHCVNGVPTTAKGKQIMSGGSIWLDSMIELTEFTWVNGSPLNHDGRPVKVQDSNRSPYPKTPENYFTDEIEVIQIHGDFQMTKDRLICTWKHSKVGTVEVFQHETFNGQKRTRAVLTDQKGRKVRFSNTDDPAVLTSAKGKLNWWKGELITSSRRRPQTRKRKMNYMAA